MLSVYFGVLPAMGTFTPLFVDPLANLSQLIFPALTLGFAFAASVTRISRSAMLDVLSDDYVRTARSKGASARSVVWRHALPNALIPVVTLSGVEFGYLLGGAVIVEEIFALPGIGRLVLDAINQRDYALVQGTVLFIAFNFLIVNLLVDLAYVALDPRIRLGSQMMALLRAIARHPSGRIGAAIILVYVVAAVLGALGLTPHDPLQQFRIDRLKAPTGDLPDGHRPLRPRHLQPADAAASARASSSPSASVALATLAGTVDRPLRRVVGASVGRRPDARHGCAARLPRDPPRAC